MGLFGLALVSAGLLALFASVNDAGTAVTVASGAIIFVMAVIGLAPVRGRAGDFAWELVDLAEDVADAAGATTATRLVAHIASEVSPEVGTATLRRLETIRDYERSVTDALRRVGGPDLTIAIDVRLPDGRRLDAEVTLGNRRVSVDIKYSAERRNAYRRLIEALGLARMVGGPWLVVMNHLPPAVIDDDQLLVVQWQSQADDAALGVALRKALAVQP